MTPTGLFFPLGRSYWPAYAVTNFGFRFGGSMIHAEGAPRAGGRARSRRAAPAQEQSPVEAQEVQDGA